MNRLALASVLQVAAVPAAAGLLIGMLGRHFWLFDLFAHFRAQYVVVLAICGLLCLLLNCFKLGGINLAVAIVAGWTLLPLSVPSQTSNGASLKLISYNVYTGSEEHEEVRKFLRSESADVVFLMETDRRWTEELRELADLYPYRLESPREDNFGIVLLSKLRFAKSEVLFFGAYNFPGADIIVEKDSHTYQILGIHPLPPTSYSNSADRKLLLSEAAKRSAQSTTPHRMLVGDLNLTPYSPWFPELLKTGKLQNIAPGYDPTWQRESGIFAIPIDHVLTSPSLRVVTRKVGPSFGSDHNALIVEVAPN